MQSEVGFLPCAEHNPTTGELMDFLALGVGDTLDFRRMSDVCFMTNFL
jgi:hypothetical protein